MIWAIMGFLPLWIIAGCCYFIVNLGNKGAGQKWWEKVLLAPTLLILMIIGFKNRRRPKKM